MALNLALDPDWLAPFNRTGRFACPMCGPSRKPEHRQERTLRVTVDAQGVRAHCHHCSVQAIKTFGYQEQKRMTPQASVVSIDDAHLVSSDRLTDHRPLDQRALSYLASRGIGPEAAAHYGLVAGTRRFVARQGEKGGDMDGVGFPYTDKRQTYAIKWRSLAGKNFTQDGSAATLFGPPTPAGQPMVICEGEVDAVSVFQATGYTARSIPAGAANSPSAATRMPFLDRSFEEIKAADRVILWLDNDAPGIATAMELARRIGKNRVYRIRPAEGRKDANDVLRQDGAAALAALIETAEPWPIEGLMRPSDASAKLMKLHKDGLPPGRSTGWRSLDPHLTVQTGMLYIVTGRPGGGKSTWLDNLMVKVADRSGWTWAVASFESPIELQLSRLIAIRSGLPFADLPTQDVEKHLDWTNQHFAMLTNEGMVTTASVIERAEAAVMRYGARGLVVDPFNYIRDPGREANTEWINELLAQLKMFAVAHDVAVFLVAHPGKPGHLSNSDDWTPGGYSISGSANFFNRADFGITVGRTKGVDELEGDAEVTIWKAKWSHLGREGKVSLMFDRLTERFTEPHTPVGYDR